jgi:hypothetical protein
MGFVTAAYELKLSSSNREFYFVPTQYWSGNLEKWFLVRPGRRWKGSML